MSTAPAARAVDAGNLSLCQSLVTFVDSLFGRSRGFGQATVGRGRTAARRLVPAGRTLMLPGWLVEELEFDTPDDIRLSVATTKQAGGLLDLAALFVEIDLPAMFDQRTGWGRSVDAEAHAWEQLEQFPIPPSAV